MNKEETLLKYISDMAAAEHHLTTMLKAQESNTDLKAFPEINQLIVNMREISEGHLTGLQRLAKSLNGEARSGFKETVASVTGGAIGALSHLRTHNVSKMLRDDYTSLSLNAIGYSMLHTTGIALDSPEVAELSLTYLRNVANLIMVISQAVVPVVVTELGETTAITITAADTARTNIRTAWRNA